MGVGERKAQRKRVVLSNTNALEVQGMEDFSAEGVPDASRLGHVLGLPTETMDSLRANEAFKATQGWSMFRRPATLIRKETVEMGKLVDEAAQKRTVRRVVYGDRGSGKSVLMLQAMAMAHLKNWVVIHVPEGILFPTIFISSSLPSSSTSSGSSLPLFIFQFLEKIKTNTPPAKDLTIGHTSYIPTTTSDGTIYVQPHYTASLLGAIGKANHTLLSTFQLSQKHDLPIPVQSNISLARLCELGARDPDIAYPFYLALWKELTAPGRPPIMYTLDGVNHIMRESAYLAADAANVHSHDLALVRHFLTLLSGKETLPNGGVVLAADANSGRPSVPALDFALSKNQAVQDGNEAPVWDPYVHIDRRVLESMEGVDVMQLKGLTKDEARGIMEYYARSGMLRSTVNEKLLGEKWTLSGGGIIGALEKASVMLRV